MTAASSVGPLPGSAPAARPGSQESGASDSRGDSGGFADLLGGSAPAAPTAKPAGRGEPAAANDSGAEDGDEDGGEQAAAPYAPDPLAWIFWLHSLTQAGSGSDAATTPADGDAALDPLASPDADGAPATATPALGMLLAFDPLAAGQLPGSDAEPAMPGASVTLDARATGTPKASPLPTLQPQAAPQTPAQPSLPTPPTGATALLAQAQQAPTGDAGDASSATLFAELIEQAQQADGDGGDVDASQLRVLHPGGSREPAPRATFDLGLPPGPVRQHAESLTDGIETRLQWMAERGIGRAQIRLTPAELGTIDVDLKLDGKHVRAEFTAGSAEVRQVLEQQLPRLRELFHAQGMTLTHADVGQRQDPQAGQHGQARPDGQAPAFAAPGADQDVDALPARSAVLRLRNGLLDEYA